MKLPILIVCLAVFSASAQQIKVNNYQVAPDVSNCFIATDDYGVIEEAKSEYPNFNIFTLAKPDNRGHVEAKFNAMTADARRNATLDFLVESEIMRKADYFIGTFSSNVGRMMALLRDDHTYSVDIEWHPL